MYIGIYFIKFDFKEFNNREIWLVGEFMFIKV